MNDYWCIPPKENAEFVAAMEDILDIYEKPYDPSLPVVCMDEKPYQCLGETRESLPMRPGDNQKTDSVYVREGPCNIFLFTEPLRGWRSSHVRKTQTSLDWEEKITYLLTECYHDHQKILLVMDNQYTHMVGSLYKRYPAQEPRSYARRLEIHYTPKHGSWLNVAEIELNVMARQYPERRLDSISMVEQQLAACEKTRNEECGKVTWKFTTPQARTKLISLYLKFGKSGE
ncbi:MAG: IS630 family transposase [Erysipelotrichia bacterium]|nr:IS630 family transposase [Erysipelotrichia bacterium]